MCYCRRMTEILPEFNANLMVSKKLLQHENKNRYGEK